MLKVLVALAVAAVTMGGWWFHGEIYRQAERPLRLDAEQTIIIEPGDAVAGVLGELRRRGALSNVFWGKLYARLEKRTHIQTGEFALQPGDSVKTVLDRLESGQVVQHHWTIVPGWTVKDMLRSFEALHVSHTPGLNSMMLVDALKLPGADPEGWFLPDTYAYVRGEGDMALARRAYQAMQQHLAQIWAERDEGLPYSDPEELLIAASLVEKETGHPEDRPLIASVFVRRLQKGMRLQTDPTVIYGLGDAFDGNLTRKHLRTPGPYNTYTIHGLPPTPIALPGRPALEAAAHPAETDYLYFVARGDGTSQFSRTLAEHTAAVRRYQLNR